ncbi:hypothetical protein CDAR_90451 [Caerostris darwini]|uniref:Secreted protein n=1 Tax=Caerostris darwini TaxID=1538125 RepID=A0AAV4SW36_9ARAC|nr:hypothetical protein CDAR_90451 [Caerostris darwini]
MRPFGILPLQKSYMRTYSICISSLGLVCLLPTKHFGAELNPSTLSHSLACSEARFSLAQKISSLAVNAWMNTDRKQRLFRHFAEISKRNVTERGLP